MTEISRFTWWFFGVFVIVASAMLNWKKFFLFILVGAVFIVAGLVRHAKGSKNRKIKKQSKQKEDAIRKHHEMERERERIHKRLELHRSQSKYKINRRK